MEAVAIENTIQNPDIVEFYMFRVHNGKVVRTSTTTSAELVDSSSLIGQIVLSDLIAAYNNYVKRNP